MEQARCRTCRVPGGSGDRPFRGGRCQAESDCESSRMEPFTDTTVSRPSPYGILARGRGPVRVIGATRCPRSRSTSRGPIRSPATHRFPFRASENVATPTSVSAYAQQSRSHIVRAVGRSGSERYAGSANTTRCSFQNACAIDGLIACMPVQAADDPPCRNASDFQIIRDAAMSTNCRATILGDILSCSGRISPMPAFAGSSI